MKGAESVVAVYDWSCVTATSKHSQSFKQVTLTRVSGQADKTLVPKPTMVDRTIEVRALDNTNSSFEL